MIIYSVNNVISNKTNKNNTSTTRNLVGNLSADSFPKSSKVSFGIARLSLLEKVSNINSIIIMAEGALKQKFLFFRLSGAKIADFTCSGFFEAVQRNLLKKNVFHKLIAVDGGISILAEKPHPIVSHFKGPSEKIVIKAENTVTKISTEGNSVRFDNSNDKHEEAISYVFNRATGNVESAAMRNFVEGKMTREAFFNNETKELTVRYFDANTGEQVDSSIHSFRNRGFSL